MIAWLLGMTLFGFFAGYVVRGAMRYRERRETSRMLNSVVNDLRQMNAMNEICNAAMADASEAIAGISADVVKMTEALKQ